MAILEPERAHPGITTTTLAPEDTERRAHLAAFLRSRRGRLQPDDVGLAPGARRRTPGLRREEVALLAGVGTTWYTWLEQGRPVRPSRGVVDAVARALRLDASERRHLFVLAREEDPGPGGGGVQVGERTQRLLDHLGVPAYITDRRWDVVASNRGARLLLGCAACPLGTRNVLWSVLVDPTRRSLFEDWEGVAQSVLAEFRHAAAGHLGEPAFTELIDALTEASPEFRAWWPRYDVVGVHTGRKVFNHPTVGRLVLEHQPLTLPDARDLKLTAYVPLDEDDAPARLARLLALPDPDDEG